MALIDINLKPSKDVLKDFAMIALVMLTIIAFAFHWIYGLSSQNALYLCGIGLVIFLLSRISPSLVIPIYIILTLITVPIGLVISFTVMAIFYYGLLTPIGLIFKIIGRDTMERKWDKECNTYWVEHKSPESTKRYYNQF